MNIHLLPPADIELDGAILIYVFLQVRYVFSA